MLESLLTKIATFPMWVVLVLSLGIIYYLFFRSKNDENYPPMPCRPYPILGHAPLFKPDLAAALMAWRGMLGHVFRFHIGPNMYVVLSGYDELKEALVKQADYFSDRPKNFSLRVFSETKEGLMTGFGGNTWREHRHISLTVLKEFGMGKNYFATKICEEVDVYMKALSDLKGKATDVKILTNAAVSNVITSLLIGNRFEYDNQYFTTLIELMSKRVAAIQTSSLLDVFWWLDYIPGDLLGAKKVWKITEEVADLFCDFYIDKFSRELDDTENENFIKASLREIKTRHEAGEYAEVSAKTLSRALDTIFTAGTETTSTTILWSMVFAMNYPETQKKVYEEIKSVVGTERMPSVQDQLRLKYLKAFITETQRLGSLVPLSVLHICSKTTSIGGCTIPEGALIVPHLDGVLKDEKTWGDPLVFRPERFLDEDGNVSIPEQFAPFSIGRRICLGEALARMELFLFFSAIFQRFEIVPEDPNNLPSIEPVLGATSAPKGFKVRLVERI